MPIYEGRRYVHEEGRECTYCWEWKPYSEYFRDRTRPSGYKERCKLCTKQIRHGGVRERFCLRCGEAKAGNKGVCGRCNRQTRGHLSKGVVYLVIHDPIDPPVYRGGKFNELNIRETLKAGYFPPGMIVELWKNTAYRGCFRVVGAEYYQQVLEEVEGHEPRGDGVRLVPDKASDELAVDTGAS